MRISLPGYLLVVAACSGQIAEPGSEPPTDPRAPVLCTGTDPVGIQMVRRLTGPELRATLEQTFGAEFALDLPADPTNESGLRTDESLLVVQPRFATAVHEAAIQAGEHVVAELEAFAPCHRDANEACALAFVDALGLRLYRRPLSEDERVRYRSLFRSMDDAGEPFATFARWATVAMVDSPSTLYRSEIGERRRGRYALDEYELATALAFTYTGAPPSDALLAQAQRGEIRGNEEQIANELAFSGGVATAAFRDAMFRFAEQWLRLPAIGSVGKDDPAFTPEVRAAMREETDRFLAEVLFEQNGTLDDLLLSSETYLNATLAAFYGYGSGSTEFERTTRPPEYGVGLLAQGGLLAVRATNAHSSPTRRGLLVRRDMLCQPVPPAPVGVDVFPETDAVTTRERHQVLVDESFCAGCHRLMEPIGFAYESFDEMGRVRTHDHDVPVDTSGYVFQDGVELPFADSRELATTLADMPEAESCVTALLSAYAFGLDPERSECLASADASTPLVERFVALAGTAHFRERVAEP